MQYLLDFEFLSRLWDQFQSYLNAQPPIWIHLFLFLGAFMENVFPPIPGDTLIVFGAYLAGVGTIGLVPAFFAMWAGSALGCMLIYGLAYWKGREFFLRLRVPLLSEANLDQTETWFGRYGSRLVIMNRFLPTVRAFVGIVAGLSRMHPVRMLLYVALGTLIWNSLLVYFGVMVGQNWQLVTQVLKTYNRVILVLMVAAGIGYLIWRRRRRAKDRA